MKLFSEQGSQGRTKAVKENSFCIQDLLTSIGQYLEPVGLIRMEELLMKRVLSLAIVSCMAAVMMSAQSAPTMKLKTTIPLPEIKGDFDHFAADLKSNRLYLAAEDHKSVEVFDLRSGKHLQSIGGFETPHAIVYSPEKNALFVTDSGPEDGNEGYIRVVSLDSSKVTDSIKVLAAADSAGYDTGSHLMYADTGGLEAKMDQTVIAVIDTNDAKKVNEIKVDSARVEAINFERSGSRMFANLRTKGQVGVYDKKDYKLLTTWPINGATDNVPMALDEAEHRLFVVTRKPGKLVVFDTESGKAVATLDCVGLADDMTYDEANKRIYVSGDKFVEVFSEQDPDHYTEAGKVPSGHRAKVSIYVPELKSFYVASVAEGNTPAKLLIYDVK
jgi:DNA-binding beta-propeller fold protein YncE